MSPDFDVCVIGSGAGGGPVAAGVAEAGRSVVVVEKGPWLREADFSKDEISECRRPRWTPPLWEEPRVIESVWTDGLVHSEPTVPGGWDLWNGVAVGGATNLMSGFFLRMKPEDFRLRSKYGPVEGADVVDWPISYDELEPWYDLVEKKVGVSGRVVKHPRAEPRSTPDFPYEPTAEHLLAEWLDRAGKEMGLHPLPLPRAILPEERGTRQGCSYSGHCGSYGCATGAKGSSRVGFIDPAVATGHCEVRAGTTGRRLESDASGRVVALHTVDREGRPGRITARVFVVACQPVETVRLLLLSTGPKHPRGLGNGTGLVGRYVLSSPTGLGMADVPYAGHDEMTVDSLRARGAFVNRTFHDWYDYADARTGKLRKGGAVDFMLSHPNPVRTALQAAKWDDVDAAAAPLWGRALQQKLARWHQGAQHLRFETFCDWMPTAESRISLDPELRDKWGVPVSRVRFGEHPANVEVSEFLAARGGDIFRKMGATNVRTYAWGGPSTNLVAGGCRFGSDPTKSVLDRDCRAHEAPNLFVTDGSFMPTGGSVPYTFTLYANGLRVASKIVADLGGPVAPKGSGG